MSHNIIKTCTLCGETFSSDELINDPKLRLLGMVLVPEEENLAYYLLQHKIENCGTCFAVDVRSLAGYLTELATTDEITIPEGCDGNCANPDDLTECSRQCRYAPFRRFVYILNKRKSGSVKLE